MERAGVHIRVERMLADMDWDEFVSAAQAISWVAYLGTADADGRPHVSAVAPGFSPGTLWIATRPGSKKFRNLRENRSVAFYWPVGTEGPGELAAWGAATVRESDDDKNEIWDAGHFPFTLSQFFGAKEQADVAFGEVAISRARLLGPNFVAKVWVPSE